MIFHRNLATAVTVAAAMLASTAARASDQYSFPSAGGTLIAASKPTVEQFQFHGVTDRGALTPSVDGMSASIAPPLAVSPDALDHFAARSRGLDAFSYRMLTHALSSAAVASYAADYARLFMPGLAVSTWTDRVSTGLVEVDYGNAVDSWTAGAYYLSRLRGSARHGESPADLSLMPTFRAHPELQPDPTFTHGN